LTSQTTSGHSSPSHSPGAFWAHSPVRYAFSVSWCNRCTFPGKDLGTGDSYRTIPTRSGHRKFDPGHRRRRKTYSRYCRRRWDERNLCGHSHVTPPGRIHSLKQPITRAPLNRPHSTSRRANRLPMVRTSRTKGQASDSASAGWGLCQPSASARIGRLSTAQHHETGRS
jgi:hypothetical protein